MHGGKLVFAQLMQPARAMVKGPDGSPQVVTVHTSPLDQPGTGD